MLSVDVTGADEVLPELVVLPEPVLGLPELVALPEPLVLELVEAGVELFLGGGLTYLSQLIGLIKSKIEAMLFNQEDQELAFAIPVVV